MTTATRTDVGYRLERVGLVMEPQPGNDLEVEGVLNPGSGRGPDGQLYLLPRIVAAGNVSRVGLARVLVEDGRPVGVRRESIWIGYVPVEDVARDRSLLTRWTRNRFLAGPEFPFEALKIGGGPAPYRVPEGWLLLHHGVTGRIDSAFAQQKHVNYAAG